MYIDEQKSYMRIALDLSQNALNRNREPFGAIIVKDREIVGCSLTTIRGDNDLSVHAEVLAIRDACKNLKSADLSGCHIYCSSEPCPMCLAAIYWAQISSIFYCNQENKTVTYKAKNTTLQKEPLSAEIKLKIKSIRIPYT
ncbi:MAG TPA: nucleoside deaminase, partial [Bacteroidales bacterium]|nr:nucleoside deaminase [Bacteroidales bacterium]